MISIFIALRKIFFPWLFPEPKKYFGVDFGVEGGDKTVFISWTKGKDGKYFVESYPDFTYDFPHKPTSKQDAVDMFVKKVQDNFIKQNNLKK